MIIVHYPQDLKEAENWRQRLESMTVPHLLVASEARKPSLSEGGRKITGIAAINEFLDQYEQDVAFWNQDRCDMWFFDEE